MAARALLLASARANARRGSPAAGSLLVSCLARSAPSCSSSSSSSSAFARTGAASSVAAAGRRHYVALPGGSSAASGPSAPITSQGTPREANPADPVTKTAIPPASTAPAPLTTPASESAAPPAAHPGLPHNTVPAGSGAPLGTGATVDAIAETTTKGGFGGSGAGGSAGSTPPPPPPPPSSSEQQVRVEYKKRSTLRKWVVRFARTVLVVLVGSTGYIVYAAYVARHPPAQLDYDPTKKNLVILGNGWASTSLLKSIDTEGYNVTVISPRNYFLFTPLLPSVTVGTLESRSIIEPTRFITRHKVRAVANFEGEATDIDVANKTVTFHDTSEIKGAVEETTIPYDYLVVNVGAANQTFGIKGVNEHACFLKETWDAEKIRTRLMDCIETATFKGQSEDEVKRLLHMVVVGGGPTGVEYAAELHDFLVEDLAQWYPEIAKNVRITLVEALPNVLPMFSKQLIDYTSATFKENKIDVLTRTMVKEVQEKKLVAQDERKNIIEIPYGLLVWATGNTSRPLTRKLQAQIGEKIQNQRRGLVVDEMLRVAGAPDVFACGDATATSYAPTAQVASQQGKYLARIFNQMTKKEELEDAIQAARSSKSETHVNLESLIKQYNRAATFRPFAYSHQGSLAYIGSDKAIADLPFFNGNLASGGAATFLFWRSAYISTLFSLRNRSLVVLDWVKVKIWGRDVSRE